MPTVFRHGLTTENERSQYIGWTNSSLSEQGRRETKVTAQKLSGWQPDRIISSDLLRCKQTSELLFPHQEIETLKAFREMNFGKFEEKTYEELKEQADYQQWLNDIFQVKPPNGESFHDFSTRVKKGMIEITHSLREKDQDIVFVVHGGVVRLLLSIYVDSDQSFFDWQIPNSQGYKLCWKDKANFRRGERCISLSVVPLMASENG